MQLSRIATFALGPLPASGLVLLGLAGFVSLAVSPAVSPAAFPSASPRATHDDRVEDDGREAEVLGTIRATLDGRERTWFVIRGTSSGRPHASALWLETGEDRLVSVGGYDTDDPPLDTFEFDADTGPVSFGDYEGSAISVVVTMPPGATSFTADLSSSGGTSTVAYMAVATTDFTSAYLATAGTIEVTDASFANEIYAMKGRFSATLQRMDGSGSIEVTNGSFEVAGVPSRESLGAQ